MSHVPNIIETLHEHAEMVRDHGHSHGFAEDMLAALHGHSHDVIDHDHSKALAGLGERLGDGFLMPSDPQANSPFQLPPPIFRIDRPPRV